MANFGEPKDDEEGAYAEGWRAYYIGGANENANPYPHGSWNWFIWREGWRVADANED